MATCLSDAGIRAAADDEASLFERQHLKSCVACRERVNEARRAGDELMAMSRSVAVPASLRDRVGRMFTERRAYTGATTLRQAARTRRSSARLWLTAAAAAALAVVVALPPLDAPRTLSAAEILDRSLQTFSAGSGTELREFDLALQVPRIATVQNGVFRIEQLVDHETPGRYRMVRYAPDGTWLDAISEDPLAGTRTALVRIDGQPFAFRFTIDPGHTLGLRDLERHHVEAMIRVLQSAAGQTVQEVDEVGGRRYVVELPQVSDATASGLWELSRARVVVDADEFRILELAVTGSYMAEPFSVSFHLRRREMLPSAQVASERFEVPADAGAITIDAAGTDDLGRDLLASALREVARSRRGQR
jgi:hypothetical protein